LLKYKFGDWGLGIWDFGFCVLWEKQQNKKQKKKNIFLKNWCCVVGVWVLGVWFWPQTPNPQSPIPNPQSPFCPIKFI